MKYTNPFATAGDDDAIRVVDLRIARGFRVTQRRWGRLIYLCLACLHKALVESGVFVGAVRRPSGQRKSTRIIPDRKGSRLDSRGSVRVACHTRLMKVHVLAMGRKAQHSSFGINERMGSVMRMGRCCPILPRWCFIPRQVYVSRGRCTSTRHNFKRAIVDAGLFQVELKRIYNDLTGLRWLRN